MTDILTFGPDKPPRRPSRQLVVLGVLALLIGGTGFAAVSALGDRNRPPPVTPTAAIEPTPEPDSPPCRPVGWAQTPTVADAPAGLTIIDSAGQGYGLVRCDRSAANGPWAVVVRRPGGSLGRGGAVVTFPVAAPPAARRVNVHGSAGTTQPGMVTWPVAGAYARVRGDLPESELIAIATRTTVAGGRPVVRPPSAYTLVSSGPYRPPAIHEVRYGSAELGEQAALGNGPTYTGMNNGGGFEDQLYAAHADEGGLVGGRRAVVSPLFGGNATLAWEPVPGIVAYIGYSGAQLDATALAALRRLANRTQVLDARQWETIDQQTVDQLNEPG